MDTSVFFDPSREADQDLFTELRVAASVNGVLQVMAQEKRFRPHTKEYVVEIEIPRSGPYIRPSDFYTRVHEALRGMGFRVESSYRDSGRRISISQA